MLFRSGSHWASKCQVSSVRSPAPSWYWTTTMSASIFQFFVDLALFGVWGVIVLICWHLWLAEDGPGLFSRLHETRLLHHYLPVECWGNACKTPSSPLTQHNNHHLNQRTKPTIAHPPCQRCPNKWPWPLLQRLPQPCLWLAPWSSSCWYIVSIDVKVVPPSGTRSLRRIFAYSSAACFFTTWSIPREEPQVFMVSHIIP